MEGSHLAPGPITRGRLPVAEPSESLDRPRGSPLPRPACLPLPGLPGALWPTGAFSVIGPGGRKVIGAYNMGHKDALRDFQLNLALTSWFSRPRVAVKICQQRPFSHDWGP